MVDMHFIFLQGFLYSSLMMEAVRTSETSVNNHFTRQYNPEDSSEQHFLDFYKLQPTIIIIIIIIIVIVVVIIIIIIIIIIISSHVFFLPWYFSS
jgi:hypothetical protein